MNRSTQPRWRQPLWAAPGVLAGAWAGLIVYGSMLPLRFDVSGFIRGHNGLGDAALAWITSPTWRGLAGRTSSLGIPGWESDLALNLVLYIPLGLLLRWALMRRSGPAWRQVLIAASSVTALSWLLESTQALMPGRYPSINDFLANVLPGIAAVLLAPLARRGVKALARWTWTRARSTVRACYARARRRPVAEALVVVIAGIALMLARPADIGSTWHPFVLDPMPFAHHFAQPYDVAMWELARSAATYSLLAMLTAVLLGRARLKWTIAIVTALVLAAEVVRGLTHTGRLDLTEPIVAAATATLFVAAVIYTGRALAGRRLSHPA